MLGINEYLVACSININSYFALLQYELTSPLGDISSSFSQEVHLGNAIMNYHEIDMFLYTILLYWKYFFSCCSYFGQVILRILGRLPQKRKT
jgi:hypothetical protein